MPPITPVGNLAAPRGERIGVEQSAATKSLTLLSVVIPARDEEECIGSTVEHLHLELRLRDVPHEIVVVDDGSTDGTWRILEAAVANLFSRVLFGIRLNDATSAFKAYRKIVIDGCQPMLSPHFNITVELPLKAIVRGYSWKAIPITWRNRCTRLTKLEIRKMGNSYFFIVAYMWLEKSFGREDSKRADILQHA